MQIKPKIMLVEDEVVTALDLTRMLEKSNYDVSEPISSGEEAIERVEEINPDLIIMDVFLSDRIDGIEAAKKIADKQNIPLIYLTANADSNTIKRADATKHYGYLLKPISAIHLNAVISTALKRHVLECE